MNIPLLRQVQQKILEHPEHFDMSDYILDENQEYPDGLAGDVLADQNYHCGTVGCIAGWAVALHPEMSHTPARSVTKDTGMRALQISDDQAHELFYTSGWDLIGIQSYYAAKFKDDYRGMAEVASKAIDSFIARYETP